MGVPVSSGRPAGKPMPAGINQAVVVEVGPLETRPNNFGEKNADGTPKVSRQCAVTFKNAAGEESRRWYTPSFHERAALAKDLKGVLAGAPLPDPRTFDLQATWPNGLLGMQAQLLIAPHERNARGYINSKIQAVMAPAVGQHVVPGTPATNVPPPNAAPGVYPVAAPATPPPAAAGVPTTSEVGF